MSRTIIVYNTYSFRDKDPEIDRLRTLAQKDGRKWTKIALEAGLSPSTPRNWFIGKVRRPQSAAIEAFGRACGYRRDWVKIRPDSRKTKG